MKLAVVGTGYVGLVSGVCFAELGNHVVCIDKDQSKIDKLREGIVPIYEPGLEQLIIKNTGEGRLSFSMDLLKAVEDADIIIIAVGTPQLPTGEANLQFVDQVAREIAVAMNGYKVVVTKSTVPVGTNERVKSIIQGLTAHSFDVVSVPEFLREGSAIQDTFNPDRVVIGAETAAAAEMLAELHRPLTSNIFITDIRSAEMIKYASNAFLATKITFINEIANLCEKVGADVTQVSKGMGSDKRIGASFLNAGIGYGGSCFPKDTQALVQIANQVEYQFKLLHSVIEVNKEQRLTVIQKLTQQLGGRLSGRTIGVWGLAFKPNTDDVRDAPSLDIIPYLIDAGAVVKVYDPVAMERFSEVYNHPNVQWCSDAYEASVECDAVCLLTEWKEFADIELNRVKSGMSGNIIIDGRNVFNYSRMADMGFVYESVGRPSTAPRNEAEESEKLQVAY